MAVKQIPSLPIVLKETGFSRNLKSNANFELRCISEALRMFLTEQTDTELASVLVQNRSFHESVHYNSFIRCFFPSFYICVMYDSKNTVPVRSIHSTTIIHTINTNELQNNELVKSMEARSQFF